MQPDPEITPEELWRRLNESPRPSDLVNFPRNDGEGRPIARVRIQVLTLEQHDEARLRALEYFREKRRMTKEQMDGDAFDKLLGDATACELLALACVSVKPLKGTDDGDGSPRYLRMFPDAQFVKTRLTADEVAALFANYLQVQRRFGPTEKSMEKGDVDAWIERLERGANAYPLVALDWHQLAELTCSLAARASSPSPSPTSQSSNSPPISESDPETSPTGTSSAGSRPDDFTATGGASLEPDVVLSTDQAMTVARSFRGDTDISGKHD